MSNMHPSSQTIFSFVFVFTFFRRTPGTGAAQIRLENHPSRGRRRPCTRGRGEPEVRHSSSTTPGEDSIEVETRGYGKRSDPPLSSAHHGQAARLQQCMSAARSGDHTSRIHLLMVFFRTGFWHTVSSQQATPTGPPMERHFFPIGDRYQDIHQFPAYSVWFQSKPFPDGLPRWDPCSGT